MIVDRYYPINLFELIPKLKLELEPELAQLDRLLEDDFLFERVKGDLGGRYPNSARLGRHSTPVEVILRMLVVKRLYNSAVMSKPSVWSPIRSFCGSSVACSCKVLQTTPPSHPLGEPDRPQDDRITQNERAVELARSLKLSRGRKLRVEAMVVETNIHHPTAIALFLATG
jgi:IS5 family transposase